ncbi:MAG: DNA cytosine methyltransferase [Phenylobacterium sp.]|nr:DNA cytosine methyltransferase [Phenylobacterium sp.]
MASHSDDLHPEIRGLSLCAGYGGLDLGVHIAEPGYRTVCYVERDLHAAATIAARMEDGALSPAPIWDDLRSFDGRPWRGRVHLLLAGYPCQPFSVAGKRRGVDDPRHLWPEVRRIIDEVRPAAVFAENVAGHLTLGFPEVAGDLRTLGYGVTAGLFSAAEVGAPHIRKRLFILANADVRGGSQSAGPDHIAGGHDTEAAVRHHEPRGEPDFDRGDGSQLVDILCGGPGDGAEADGAAGRLFAPRPSDFPAWERLLRIRPDVQPAVPRDAHGLADRLDRSRGTGNGVVSLAAALAYRTLSADADRRG